MTPALLLLPLLASAGVSDVRSDTVRILVMDTSGASADRPELVRLIDGSIAEALSRPASFDVVTRQDIKQLVNLEAERAAMACEGTNCLVEVAAALGARYVVYSTLTVIPGAGKAETWVVQLNLVDAHGGRAIARQSARGEGALIAADNAKKAVAILTSSLLEPGDESFADLLGEDAQRPAPSPAEPINFLLLGGASASAVGAVTVIAGVGMILTADPVFNDPTLPREDRLAAQSLAQAGTVTSVAGGVILAAGIGLLTWSFLSPAAE